MPQAQPRRAVMRRIHMHEFDLDVASISSIGSCVEGWGMRRSHLQKEKGAPRVALLNRRSPVCLLAVRIATCSVSTPRRSSASAALVLLRVERLEAEQKVVHSVVFGAQLLHLSEGRKGQSPCGAGVDRPDAT
eukprot:scaffold789_cov125-Isochrysis_galbana.AAC.14